MSSLLEKTEFVMTKHFCRKLVTTSVESDAYPLSNLLDGIRSNGFMVAHFVKAPVLIRFEFEQSIRLIAIEIGLKVGAQKATALEIYFGSKGIEDVMNKLAYVKVPTGKDVLMLKLGNNQLVKEICPLNSENTFEFLVPNKRFGVSTTNQIRSIGINVVRSVGVPCIKFIRVITDSSFNADDSNSNANANQNANANANANRNAIQIDNSTEPKEFLHSAEKSSTLNHSQVSTGIDHFLCQF